MRRALEGGSSEDLRGSVDKAQRELASYFQLKAAALSGCTLFYSSVPLIIYSLYTHMIRYNLFMYTYKLCIVFYRKCQVAPLESQPPCADQGEVYNEFTRRSGSSLPSFSSRPPRSAGAQ